MGGGGMGGRGGGGGKGGNRGPAAEVNPLYETNTIKTQLKLLIKEPKKSSLGQW
jgi:hypothetical protein